jgi:MFS family permease
VFWAGQGVSWTGGEISAFAVPLVAALTLDATPAQMALLVAAVPAPALLAGLLVGPFVDRRGPRSILLGTEYGRAGLLALVPLLAWTGGLSIPVLVAVAFGIGCLTEAYAVASLSLVPTLVPPDRLLDANSRLNGTYSVAQVAGPGAAGFVVGVVGPARTVLLDVASYLLSALSVHLLPTTPAAAAPAGGDGGPGAYLAQVRAGLDALWWDVRLRLLGLGSGGFNLFVGMTSAVELLYLLRTVGLQPGQLGVAMAAGLAGGIGAAVAAGRVHRAAGLRATLVLGLLVAAPGPLLLLAAGGTGAAAPWLAAAGFGVNSAGVTLYVITNQSLRQALVVPALRGRVFASARMVSRAGLLLGALAGGVLASVTSLGTVLVVSAGGQLLAGVVFLRLRHLVPDHLAPDLADRTDPDRPGGTDA